LAVHDPYEALRYHGYRCLLAGGVVTSIGAGMQTVAVSWEMWERTSDEWNLALIGLVQFLPILLLALPAGQLADRFNRKVLVQLAQALGALASLGLMAVSMVTGPVWLMLFFLTIFGIARAFTAPARQSLLPQIVPPGTLPNAVAWNSTGWQIANVSGPLLGGLLVWRADAAWPVYFLTACCSFGYILFLIPVSPRQTEELPTSRSLADLFAGVRFVWHTKLLLAAISLDLFAVLLGGATALLPIYAKEILHVDKLGLGVLRSAPALGATLMAVAMAHLPPLRRPGVALLIAVAGFGAATIAFGVSQDFWLSYGLLALAGAFDNVSVVVRGTLMQSLTPNSMRGRVSAVNTVFISSSNELGEFESGAVAKATSAEFAVVSGGIGTLGIVLGAMLIWPQLLLLGPLHKLRPEEKREEKAEAVN